MLKWTIWEFSNDHCASLCSLAGHLYIQVHPNKMFPFVQNIIAICASADKKISTIITLNNVWKLLHFTSVQAHKHVTGIFFSIKPYFTDAYVNAYLKNYLAQLLQCSFNTLISKEVLPKFWLPVWVSNFVPRNTISTKITSICRGSAGVVCKSHQWIWSTGQ